MPERDVVDVTTALIHTDEVAELATRAIFIVETSPGDGE